MIDDTEKALKFFASNGKIEPAFLGIGQTSKIDLDAEQKQRVCYLIARSLALSDADLEPSVNPSVGGNDGREFFAKIRQLKNSLPLEAYNRSVREFVQYGSSQNQTQALNLLWKSLSVSLVAPDLNLKSYESICFSTES